ncbi:MAG: archease [Candidatus Omnitrophica bacterium]|nr:archease [Candidatus Omnitrophota bacterium]
MKRYELVEHTSDIAIKVYGESLADLFVNAAYGMFDIIADLEGLKPSTSVKIELEAANAEELLVSWLDELIYNFYTKYIIFSEFKIYGLNDTKVSAEAFGKHIGENRSRLKTEIKAATYHGLRIEEKNKIYEVQIIFDV